MQHNTQMGFAPDIDFVSLHDNTEGSLINLLDTLLDKGVVLHGDLSITVADVDLIHIGLKALICSFDTAERYRIHSAAPTTKAGKAP